jgi:hypothetical protein
MIENNAELLRLATKANQMALRVSRENETRRVAGRLARDPHDADALSQAIVREATEGGVLAGWRETDEGLLLLLSAIAQVSYLCWEDLWSEAHPDRLGQAWSGEDFDLMSVWRERVRTIIRDCRQEWLFTVSDPDQYMGKLAEAGADGKQAEELADWLSNLRCA